MRAITRRQWLGLGLGLAVSGLAAWLVLRRVSLAGVGRELARLDPATVLGLAAAKLLLLWLKERRWRGILAAMAAGTRRATFRAVAAGYFGNLVLPFKIGELIRIGTLRRHNTSLPLADIGATVGSERLLDVTVLALLTLVVLPLARAPAWIEGGAGLLLAVALGALALVLPPRLHGRLLAATGGGWLGSFFRAGVRALAHGTAVFRRPRALLTASLWTLVIWLLEAAVFWRAARSFALPVGYPAALVVTLLYTFGGLIPSAPVQVGTHQALAVLFLGPFGVGHTEAVSLSVLLQGINLAVLGLCGGPALVWEAARPVEPAEPQGISPTAKISDARSGSSRPKVS